ncbi:ABC transporter permease, partial [Stutzerimonas nitrititolerans]|uniref:ABC transporter permease n=2 Tax=Bacteria TaxID=2 RepID=UPI001BDBC034
VDISQDDSSEANIGAVVTVLIAVGLMSFFIMLFAGNIGSRVTEEKSSRVVEIILATVRPLDFLGGKLIANVILGVVSSLLILGSGAIAISATGLLKDFHLDTAVLPLMLLSFIIGLLFFGSLYAAAGSMVSRTEDLQSTQA